MNLVGIIKEFCAGRGLPIPSSVQSSPDAQILQMISKLNDMNLDLLTRKSTQFNQVLAQFTSSAADDQGSIHDLARFGYQAIVPNSMWDRTTNMPILGGTQASDWAWLRTFNPPQQVAGANQYRIQRDRLYFLPPLPAGHEIRFEYVSSFFVRDKVTTATPYKAMFVLDTDESVFGDELPRAYLRWAWPQAKGLDYAEEFAAYERLVMTKFNYANSPMAVHMDSKPMDRHPAIIVPPGSWPLSN